MGKKWLRFSAAIVLVISMISARTLPAQTIYEAEAIPVQARQNCTVGSFPGVGFVENITQQGAAGTQQNASSLTFSVTVPTAGVYTVMARYAAARAYAWTMSVYINNQDVTQARFPSTASWSTWATQTISVTLAAGTNTVMYRYDNDDSGWINLDYIQVSPDSRSVGYSTGGASANGWFPQEVAVDKFTGTAQVHIPLANVTAPGISVPVGLSYVASGVQVDEVGSAVGVNWSLQAGMSIRREVRGLPDDVQSLSSTENRYGWLRFPTGSSPGTSLATINNAPSTINPSTTEPNRRR